MAYHPLPTFETEGRFIVARPFTFNGRELKPGDSVAEIPPRRLRQLFDLRRVAYAEASLSGKKGK